MYGFTTTFTGITFDQAMSRTIEAIRGAGLGLLLPCNVIDRKKAPERVVWGFLDPQIGLGLLGKPEVQAVADAAERPMHGVRARLSDNVAPDRAV
jgi:hypothetical protein